MVLSEDMQDGPSRESIRAGIAVKQANAPPLSLIAEQFSKVIVIRLPVRKLPLDYLLRVCARVFRHGLLILRRKSPRRIQVRFDEVHSIHRRQTMPELSRMLNAIGYFVASCSGDTSTYLGYRKIPVSLKVRVRRSLARRLPRDPKGHRYCRDISSVKHFPNLPYQHHHKQYHKPNAPTSEGTRLRPVPDDGDFRRLAPADC